jgi:hypothetical protein
MDPGPEKARTERLEIAPKSAVAHFLLTVTLHDRAVLVLG